MNLKEYQSQAKRTMPDLGELELNLLHMKMGVITEVGEAVDQLKKHIAYGKKLDWINLREEVVGDINWYLVNESTLIDLDLVDFEKENEKDITKGIFSFLEDITNFLEFYLSNNLTHKQKISSCILLIKNISDTYGLGYFTGLQNNIDKLKVRFPDKFDQNKALHRNLEAERIELEK